MKSAHLLLLILSSFFMAYKVQSQAAESTRYIQIDVFMLDVTDLAPGTGYFFHAFQTSDFLF